MVDAGAGTAVPHPSSTSLKPDRRGQNTQAYGVAGDKAGFLIDKLREAMGVWDVGHVMLGV